MSPSIEFLLVFAAFWYNATDILSVIIGLLWLGTESSLSIAFISFVFVLCLSARSTGSSTFLLAKGF
jgi:hypothetical protein